jgi:NADH dehydrogenase FAD-containing subunit
VECDASLRAVGTDNVYAVGDVARWPHPRYGMMRAEHWISFAEQARVVAAGITEELRVVLMRCLTCGRTSSGCARKSPGRSRPTTR